MTIRAFAICMLRPGATANPILGQRRPCEGQLYGATPCDSPAFSSHWRLHRLRLDVAPPRYAFHWPADCALISAQSLETAFEIEPLDADEAVIEADDGNPNYDPPIVWPKDLRTYDVRRELAALGCSYDPTTKQWTLPADRYEEAKALIEGVTQPTLKL